MKAKKLIFKKKYVGLDEPKGMSTIKFLKQILMTACDGGRTSFSDMRALWGVFELIEGDWEAESLVISGDELVVLKRCWEAGAEDIRGPGWRWMQVLDDVIASAEDVELKEKT